MAVVHIYVPEGWVSPKRKKLMIEKVTEAVVEAEGVPPVRDLTYVLVHDIPDGGWGHKGNVRDLESMKPHIPSDPAL
ncbi:MAG TPA: tautomerase family protein [Chryseosolibacter sp.]